MEKVFDFLNKQGVFVSKYLFIFGIVAVVLGIGQTYITVALGVAYPAFMSFLALESEGTDDDKQWLTYWVIFGLFNIIDQWSGFILTLIPFYFVIKLVFLVLLMHPSVNGATHCYNWWILPTMQKYEQQIIAAEKNIESYHNHASGYAAQIHQKVMGSKSAAAPASSSDSKKTE